MMHSHEVVQTYLEKNPADASVPIRCVLTFRYIVNHKEECPCNTSVRMLSKILAQVDYATLPVEPPPPPPLPPPPATAPPLPPTQEHAQYEKPMTVDAKSDNRGDSEEIPMAGPYTHLTLPTT